MLSRDLYSGHGDGQSMAQRRDRLRRTQIFVLDFVTGASLKANKEWEWHPITRNEGSTVLGEVASRKYGEYGNMIRKMVLSQTCIKANGRLQLCPIATALKCPLFSRQLMQSHHPAMRSGEVMAWRVPITKLLPLPIILHERILTPQLLELLLCILLRALLGVRIGDGGL